MWYPVDDGHLLGDGGISLTAEELVLLIEILALAKLLCLDMVQKRQRR